MSDNGDVNVRDELRGLVELVGELSKNHKSVLEAHERNLTAAHTTVMNHKEAIEALRADMKRYAEIVDKILARLGITAEDEIPSATPKPN